MAGTRDQPNFQKSASDYGESVRANLDCDDLTPSDGATRKLEASADAPYQDPRDELDQKRHEIFAKARHDRDVVGGYTSEAKE